MIARKNPPCACIRVKGYAKYVYCDKEISPDEYAFEDVDHALALYINSDHIRACPECVRIALKRKDVPRWNR